MSKLVSEEMVHAFAAVGTYDQIASVIKKRFAGTNRLSFDMSIRNDHDRGVLKEIVQDLRP
jgi:Ribonuclease G/E